MNAMVKVARLHLVDRFTYTWLVWAILVFTLLVNVAVFALVPANPRGNFTGAILVPFTFMTIAGVLVMTRVLPFAFTLGVSRRAYYAGTLLLMVGLAAFDAVILTVLRGHRGGDQRLGRGPPLLPGALDPQR